MIVSEKNMEPMTDKELNEKLEEANFYLKKEVASLHGKLGAQGLAIHREEKYQALERELKHMIVLYEKAVEDKESLRDKFAAKAMQGLMLQGLAFIFVDDKKNPANIAYEIADMMLKARESTKQEQA